MLKRQSTISSKNSISPTSLKKKSLGSSTKVDEASPLISLRPTHMNDVDGPLRSYGERARKSNIDIPSYQLKVDADLTP